MLPPELPIWGLAGVLLLAGVWIGVAWVRWRASRAGLHRLRSGRRAERRALRLLRKHGYAVLGTEVAGQMRLSVDGTLRTFDVRADALVERRRRRYVAEFKGGEVGSRVEHRTTRRQLIEYALAYDVDGVLLVDAVRERIVSVRLP